jgi:hypothetical protein
MAVAAITLPPVNPRPAERAPVIETVRAQTAPATTQTRTPAPTTTTKVASTAAAAATDPGWPREYAVTDGKIVVYQPQVASWDDQLHMEAWSAVSYHQTSEKTPALGTIKMEAKTKVAMEERLVNFSDFSITESNFATLSRDDARGVVAKLQASIPAGERVLSLDRVLTALDASAIRPRNVTGVKSDPPKIYGSTRPAVLVNLDGNAVWSPIKDNDLQYAVNTNWDLFQHTTSNTFYLRNDKTWLKATDLAGPWSPAGKLPPSFSKLPKDDNWKDVQSNVPGKSISADKAPTVYVSTEPAELLLLTGEPKYEAVTDTSLLWVSNTDSDLFRLGPTGSFYYLVTGRWFSSPGFEGPWTFATTSLPPDFQKIPLEHPRSRVLASVPGTPEANQAVLLAQVPQTARVNRKEVKAPEVAYQGDPQFQAIEGTSVARAVNTDKDIIKVGDVYYMCFQAVWFTSRSATGPWEVATSVPKEIYEIPPSSASHNVTYVTVEKDDNDDDWVTFAYVAGYTGMMVAYGCTVWGSGWYYPPYVWYGGMYPAYYGYPRTYGMSAWYNPWTGAYGRGASVYGPFGGASAGAVYNPRTGSYARGAAAYGPYGGRAAAQAYNPRTGTYAQTRQGSNVYGNWGTSSVQRGDDWARTGHVTNRATGNTTAGAIGSGGGGALTHTGAAGRTSVARTGSGDVYAGHDGSVYRKSSDGSWQSWENGGWNDSQRTGDAAARSGQLERDARARSEGTSRTQSAGAYRSQPTMQRAGSYGGARGAAGGGRRR